MLAFSSHVNASYSKIYDTDLNTLSVTDPKLAIKTTKELLVQAKLQGDYKRQLVLYYYLAESYFTLSNIPEVGTVVSDALEIARKHNNIRFISEFLGLESFVLGYKGELRQASKKANLALQFAKETDDYRLIASMMSVRAQAHLSSENYSLALKDVQAALTIFKEYQDRENLTSNYNLLALIYDSIGEYDKAIKYYDVSLSFDDSGSLYNQATIYYNKGTTFAFKGDRKLAIENLNLAMELSVQIKDEATLAYVRNSLGDLYIQEKQYTKGQDLALLALDWFSDNEDLLMHINTNLLLAEVNIQNSNFTQAKKFIDDVDVQLQSMTTPKIQLSVLWIKIKYFAKQKLWKEAYELSQESLIARDELYEKDRQGSIDEMKLKYDVQFDQEKMASLQKQNKLQKEVISQEQHKQQYFLGLMALAILMIMGVYYAYRNQRSIKSKLYLLTITDDLTQIANRRYILEQLGQLHKKSIEENQLYTIVMVDLDNFKAINDKYGHFKGNEVLVQFAGVATYTLPNGCEVGRLGGEEWLILLPKHDREQTELLLRKLRKNYNNPQMASLPAECQLHFSCGVKVCEGDCLDVETTLRKVDGAMYEAKEMGRNQDVYC